MERELRLPKELDTQVFLARQAGSGDPMVTVTQEAAHDGGDEDIVILTPRQARLVAAEMVRLADELEAA